PPHHASGLLGSCARRPDLDISWPGGSPDRCDGDPYHDVQFWTSLSPRPTSTLSLSDVTWTERRAGQQSEIDDSPVKRTARCGEQQEAEMAHLSGIRIGKHARALTAAR